MFSSDLSIKQQTLSDQSLAMSSHSMRRLEAQRAAGPADITITMPPCNYAHGSIQSCFPLHSASVYKTSPSPNAFVPASPHARSENPFSPPTSPFDCRKSTPSPALTATTVDSSECSIGSSLNVVKMDQLAISPITIVEGEVLTTVSFPGKLASGPKRMVADSPQKIPVCSVSPFYQNDDTGRKQRVKTELCMHIKRGTSCPFGKECVFAHSEEELRLTKLVDLVRAGMVNGETFRVLPCETFVSTGSW